VLGIFDLHQRWPAVYAHYSAVAPVNGFPRLSQ
jgi:hypothetical protein